MIKIKVNPQRGMSTAELEKINAAVQGLEKILNSDRFKIELLLAKMTETNGLTNQQVYDKIMAGDQVINGDEMGVLDFNLVLYRKSWSKVVGYTFTNSMTIWVNRKYFSTPKSISENIGHELMHQLGFFHNKIWSTSVPYTMNRIVGKLWDKV